MEISKSLRLIVLWVVVVGVTGHEWSPPVSIYGWGPVRRPVPIRVGWTFNIPSKPHPPRAPSGWIWAKKPTTEGPILTPPTDGWGWEKPTPPPPPPPPPPTEGWGWKKPTPPPPPPPPPPTEGWGWEKPTPPPPPPPPPPTEGWGWVKHVECKSKGKNPTPCSSKWVKLP